PNLLNVCPSLYPQRSLSVPFLFFPNTPTPAPSTLSLHDALPISRAHCKRHFGGRPIWLSRPSCCLRSLSTSMKSNSLLTATSSKDRKSTRLNSSHLVISYAVFCLKKKIDCRHRHGQAYRGLYPRT